MADISFKISGSSQPFLAQLWNNDCSSLIQQKPVEYSGTCVIFGGLNGNTTYNLSIRDNINNSLCYQTFNTLPSLSASSLSIKYVSLLGTLTCPDAYTRQMTSPKSICINPPLSNGECVDLKFRVETVNNSNTCNNITLYCNNNTLLPSYNNSGISSKQINLKYGDTMCYDMISYCNTNGEICGHSTLELTGVTGYGFSACTDSNYCKSTSLNIPTTTTTTTTTLAPVTVYLTNIANISSNPIIKKCYCAGLGTSRPLVSGESFRLYQTNCATSWTYEPHTYPICAYACTYPPTSFNYACSYIPNGVVGTCISSPAYNYIDVNSSNINNIRFWAVSDLITSENVIGGYGHSNVGIVNLENIVCKCGANFLLAGETYLEARLDKD